MNARLAYLGRLLDQAGETDLAAALATAAAGRSGALADDAIAVLLALSASRDRALGRLAAEVLIEALKNQAGSAEEGCLRERMRRELGSGDEKRRWIAAFTLARCGDIDLLVIDVAIEQLASADSDLRWAACELLCGALSSDRRWLERVQRAAEDADPRRRKMIFYCLRNAGMAERRACLAGLADSDRGVRLAALSALSASGANHAADPTLRPRLTSMSEDDPDPGVRRAVLHILKPRGEPMTTEDLASKSCQPCRGGVPPLTAEQIRPLLAQLDGWRAERGHHLVREFSFPDFASALAFVNRVGALAESEGHHPDLRLSWGSVLIELWTHKIDGLSESDFVLAAKIDRLPREA